ncbi:MAG TPA: carboxypeptidase-like regulatory domain-containing protein [Candidatus Polarisedimenticolaceae bacterium]|nr:carboxypeptidase-like regulatory domain-containing protein [Candidatus Polarisedimenticolaceae bacterium]
MSAGSAVPRTLSILFIWSWLVAGGAADAVAPATPATPTTPAHPAGQIRGAISYGRHFPSVGAVVLMRPEKASSPLYAATTGATGAFGFDGVPDGTYRAEVRREGYVTQVKTGIIVRAPFRAVVEVVLAPGAASIAPADAADGDAGLAGHVRISGGAPIAEVHARLVRPDAEDDPKLALTDASGGFVFPGLKAGRWRIELQGAGLLPLRADLDLSGDVVLEAALAQQPANYQPPAEDLIVPEEAVPPKN